MKKITVVTAIFTLSFFCSGLFAQQKIVFWNGHQHAEYMVKIVDEFHKKTGIEVELHQFLSPQLRDEVMNQANSNQLPDMLYVPSDFVGLYKEIKLASVPSDWISPKLDIRVKDSGKIDNMNFGVPLFQGNHLMLFYNRALVESPITDWDQLDNQISTLPENMQFPFTWNYREMYWLIPFMSAFGTWPIENHKITLNTPEMVDALNYYKHLAKMGYVDTTCDHNCSVERFKTGESAYMINGDWVIRDLQNSMGDNLGVAMLPQIEGKEMVPMFSTYVLAYPGLNSNNKKFESLKQFTLFAQDKLAQQIIRDQGGLMPVNNDLLAEQHNAKTKNAAMVLKQMQNTRTMPISNKMAITWSAMGKGFTRFMDHNYTAEKTAILMQRVADKEIKRRNKIAK